MTAYTRRSDYIAQLQMLCLNDGRDGHYPCSPDHSMFTSKDPPRRLSLELRDRDQSVEESPTRASPLRHVAHRDHTRSASASVTYMVYE